MKRKKFYIKLKIEDLRDRIDTELTQLANKLESDRVNQIEKEYESMLNTFLNKQRQIEDFVEQNKQIIKTIDKTESHEFSIITTKIVNAANYELNSAQKQFQIALNFKTLQ